MQTNWRTYRTRLYDTDGYNAWTPPYRGRSWHGDLRFLDVVGEADYYDVLPDLPESVRKYNPPRQFVLPNVADRLEEPSGEEVERGERRLHFVPEIVIRAPDRPTAQRAANLILAAVSADQGHLLFEQLLALPDPGKPLEDLDSLEYEGGVKWFLVMGGLGRACAIAARAALRRRWTYALASLLGSFRTCSVHPMETHPRYGTFFGVEKDPVNHAIFAQAITSSYSAIEELGFEVRASSSRPSKLPCGVWNPPILSDLEGRLTSGGVDLNDKFAWTIRNSPTRIERRYGIPSGTTPSWAGGLVRDRMIRVTDALHRASLIRSKTAAHGGLELTRSLTFYDVHNVQSLARRLILERLGFWRRF